MKNYELPVPVISEYEEFMLKEIDSFLGISAKFSPKGVMRIKITGFVSCIVIAAALFYAAKIFNYPKLYWFMAFSIAMALAFSTYGKGKAISEMLEDFASILNNDGIEEVYTDMKNSRKIDFSSIYVGKTYVFDRLGMLFRLENVTDVFIRKRGTDFDPDYDLCFRVYKNGEKCEHMIRGLKLSSENQRMKILAETREIFGLDK